MEKILGLDLGTNSIGWALIEQEFENQQGKILGMGSRIIPMSQDILDTFGAGKPTKTQTAERTNYRGIRRLRERHLLRRERLHRVLNLLGFLPAHYAKQIDFEKRLGKFKEEAEPKLVYDSKSFIFKKSFEEMLSDFRQHQPQLLENDRKIPYDWTIYYLRKKALAKKIEKEEIAWILLNFNQKRGYYQLREEEEEEKPNKLVEFYSLKIIDVNADERQKGKTDLWYSIILENGWIYRRASKTPLFDWKDKTKDFIVTTDLNDDGSIKIDKYCKEKRSFRAPGEDDWTLIKKKTEADITKSGRTVGEYIYSSLLQNPKQKIKGKLVPTIERKFYKEELKAILDKQIELQPELFNDDLYIDCVRELYRNNESHQSFLSKKDFAHLFINDIIFYQRPLRSQKSSISNCSLEFKKFINKEGKEQLQYLKAIPKSHPLYQEFRLWQWIYNLRIYKRDEDRDITYEFLNEPESFAMLFEFLNNQKDIDQKILLRFYKLKEKTHRWNYVDDKRYPCNETRALLISKLSKVDNLPDDFLNEKTEQQLWHIIYSVTDKKQYETAIGNFIKRYNKKRNAAINEESFIKSFIKIPPFSNDYGSYSSKAIKKLLPLMRTGKYWNSKAINDEVKEKASSILERLKDIDFNIEKIENVADDEIQKQVLKSFINKKDLIKGLQLYQASYLVYGRHSEAINTNKWNSISELENYLKEFKQHSLRNPIVEQVITETLRVVRDIWQKYGNGDKDFFDEIHIELGRDMKNNAEDRERITNQIIVNENTNLRIKALLAELGNDTTIKNVIPYSPMQQEILKIYEEGVLDSNIEIEDDILKISKTAQPSSTELKRYKLWLEQKYRSPYTGEIIPLNKLFTSEFEIEHIIPQSRYFDDSFSNKVICESAVNKLKDNQLGLEFIKNHHSEKVETGFGKTVKVFTEEEYKDFVIQNYEKNRSKRSKLLLEDIPEKMIERQINDTRYISKFICSVLSNIVRADKDDDGVNSKNLIPGNGKITTILKQDWGLNDVWNDLILPRFERLNQLTNSNTFTTYNERFQKYLPTVPIEFSKNFQKKRIDHRHHALDAVVIACATRDHINLLNNKYAKSKERFDLNRKLRILQKTIYNHPKTGARIEREVPTNFIKPWNNFTAEVKNTLGEIVISFKQNLRVINKASNKYETYKDENGNIRNGKNNNPKKDFIAQTKGDIWAIRKSMHKETVSGKIELKRIKIPKGKILTATRKNIDTSFDLKTIESITDTGIQKILKNYLLSKDNNPEIAFSPESIEDMNRNIEKYNDGKFHQPIYKARIFELGSKFPLGATGNKKVKFVEAAKGTNLFFAVYENEDGNRNYETIPLNEVIEHQKWRATLTKGEQKNIHSLPVRVEKGKFLFSLSPNDLVYVPTAEERENFSEIDFNNLTKEQLNNIYKTVSFTGSQCFFIKQEVATSIVNKVEFSSLNKMEKSINNVMIKECCIKLKVDRLGNICKANE